jgi:hypothetical protein
VRALKLRSYTLKFIAVQMLARFATNESLAGLKTAAVTTAADFDYVVGEKSSDLAVRIRAAAVDALSRSQHPKARDVLVARRRDQAEAVRVKVVHAIARFPTGQAVPLLEEMSKDASAPVREEAKRYLAQLQPEKTPPTRK